ncbi:MAG: oxygenase MpaB family protein, partial [Myxococcota bacterium]
MGESLEAHTHSLPERVVGLTAARRTYGRAIDRLLPALSRVDPLADDAVGALTETNQSVHATLDRAIDGDRTVPSPIRTLVESAADFPVWADERRLERAGGLLFRAGMPGGVALGAKSLLSGYCSPAGNKALIWSGQLMGNVSRRLGETAKFVCAVAEPGGLYPGAEGFRITLRVRLIHAQVRRLIQTQGGWRTDLWGQPINQHDMA